WDWIIMNCISEDFSMATKAKKKMSKKQMKRKKQKRMLVIEFCILLVLLVALFVWVKLGKLDFNTLRNMATNTLDDETKELLSGYTTIALFGVDNRSNGNYDSGNSDSIMICSINNDTKEVKIVSVYRDTFMDVDGNGTLKKCNYAYNHGGVEEAIEMLNRNLDLDIQNYVSVDFYALSEAVDAVGGITLPEGLGEEEASYTNQYISEVASVTGKGAEAVVAGQTELNGVQAVAYCRVRYTSGGDFKRAERQRTVVNCLVEEVKGASVFELNDLVDGILPYISTSLSASNIMGMATAMQDYTLAESHGFPFEMRTETYGSNPGSVDVPCTLESNVSELYQFLFNEQHVASTELQEISNSIINYTGFTESSAVDYGY
ncbi:MAG: LCP family protein, partial [Lachnospiraceae bacterium]|nr:LCP family protein [Lachnospiraceae bacterium]